MIHDHDTVVVDNDHHFIIDPITRNITTESPKLTLMQYDHNSERYTFEIPKIIEGHDMSTCNKVRIHFLNLGSKGKHYDIYEVDDLKESDTDPGTLIFSWLIKNTCTKFAGSLNFAIRFYCISEDGTIDYSWGTNVYSKISISEGMENSEQIIEDYSDLIYQIQKDIEELEVGRRATGDKIGGFKAWNTDGTYLGIPIEIDPSTSFAFAALNISDKTEADVDYIVEVKIDPKTRKLYIPSPSIIS